MSDLAAFKPCDVRGIYPDEVNEPLYRALAGALLARWPAAGPVVVAGDVRESTRGLMAALSGGLSAAGVEPVLLQPLPTPAAYFAGARLGAALTLVVTASHNPPAYNGLKVLAGNRPPGPEDMAALEQATAARLGQTADDGGVAQWAEASRLQAAYAEHLLRLAPALPPVTVVVDPGNGCLCGLAATVLRRAGARVTEINGGIDGRFPGRGPDPTRPGALATLARAVREAGADLGAAFDGDGDRVVFVDETGEVVAADAAITLLGEQALARHPGGAVLLDIRASRRPAGRLAELGARVAWSPPGHAFLRSAMLDERACFGGEISGHYYFSETGGDDGLYAALRLAAYAAERGPLSRAVRALPRSPALREVRLPYRGWVEPLVAALSQALAPAATRSLAGATVMEMDGAWLVVRRSITEPLLALRCEADDVARLRRVVATAATALAPFGLDLAAATAPDPVWGG